ncbi:hypothetical protein EVAR_22990_1 [Eumeta japonica]|uniref:Uncharacterized protein n=1 Tax=Eumeta variegata TaxID=151549 RepID=A0A4C1URC1_EUMVA|nr:hypothetical protein EVAR_22990_1 [Eumeta japonica]
MKGVITKTSEWNIGSGITSSSLVLSNTRGRFVPPPRRAPPHGELRTNNKSICRIIAPSSTQLRRFRNQKLLITATVINKAWKKINFVGKVSVATFEGGGPAPTLMGYERAPSAGARGCRRFLAALFSDLTLQRLRTRRDLDELFVIMYNFQGF